VEIINVELGLADLAQAERRLERARKDARTKKEAVIEVSALEKILPALEAGLPARSVALSQEEELSVKNLGLLTKKPIIYAANVSDSEMSCGNAYVEKVREFAAKEGAKLVMISAQIEAELVELEPEDRAAFLQDLGVTEGGLNSLIRAAYDLLGLQTYFTTGPKETRAWTINKGMTAPQAAGVIHTDFERGFIRAETISYQDLVETGSEKAAKEKGLMRSEGKEYVVQEGDVMLFRFNV
jgi:hypothetical protein